jgi:PAS domain S-box-containing protein
MTWLHNLPVQRKLGFAMLLTSTAALIVACAAFLTIEYFGYKKSLAQSIATLGRITAENCTAALAFSDQETATQTLETLRAEPQIVLAILYDNNGNSFAQFSTDPSKGLKNARNLPGVRVEQGFIIDVQPVVENSRQLGTLYLQASMDEIYNRMRHYALVVACVLALSVALAWMIASILRQTLSEPILELANTAEAISAYQDFNRRARQFGNDELGSLTVAFNAMLEKTQSAIRALRESEWSHRELVRALPIAAYMCDVDGRITLYNNAAVTLWGRAPEIGLECWSGSTKVFRTDGTLLPFDSAPGPVARRKEHQFPSEEIIIERPDRMRRNVMPYPEVICDTNGNVVGFVNMLLDITEQKKADADARRLAALVKSSDDAIIGKDLDGIITSWNHGAEILFGYSAEEMLGRSVMVLIPPDLAAEEASILERLRRDEPIKYEETVRQRKDGTLIDVSLTISPIKDRKGRIVGASKIAHDIRERKRAERQANFIHKLTHQLSELANPDEILRLTAREVGTYMNADRCFFCILDENKTHALIKEDWAREGFGSVSGILHTSDFGAPGLWQALAAGPLAVDDRTNHPLIKDRLGSYDALKIVAHLSAPFVRNGKWMAMLVAAAAEPRIWANEEIALLENILARVWPMVERAQSQLELRESELRLRELMQSLPISCYTVDTAGRLTFFNDAAVRLWEHKPQLGATNWFALLSPSGSELSFEASPVGVSLREKHSVRGVEAIVLRPDGSQRWVILHAAPIFETAGNCIGAINVAMDISEERAAQVKFQKSAEHLNLAMASAKLGDWNWDPVTDHLTLSPRTREIFGVPDSIEFTRTQMRRLLFEEDQIRVQDAMLQALEARSDYNIEYRVKGPDETLRWIAARGRPIYNKHGEVQAMVGVVQDITERKQQAEQLEELAQKIEAQARLFNAILSNITDLAYSFDLEGHWIYANKPLLDLWGKTLDQISGKNSFELGYPPELAARLQAQIQQVIATKSAIRGETPYVSGDGKLDDHEYIFNPVIDDNGNVTAVVGSTRLVTARKAVENELKLARDEAVAASRAKDDFLAALSHELRTPLNPVLLLASDAANNHELPPAVRKDFELIRKNVDLEARLIDDLLDITRITRGKLLLDQRPCDLRGILQDALTNVRPEILAKHIQITTDLAASDGSVWGDSVRLQQILWNILKNAVKFTPENGQILVTTENADQKLMVRITDTGIGMSAEEIGRIFKAFSQGEHASPGSNQHRFGGLGLGLAISKMLTELHGGQIQAFSDGRDKGSTFVVELPLYVGKGEIRKGPSENGHRSKSLCPFPVEKARTGGHIQLAERNILLVEDHAPTRQTLQQLLQNRHFKVVAARTATEALELAREREFNLVISDVGLPDLTGFELMAELRTIKPNLLGIALSGYGMEEDLARSRSAGFVIHLVKPVTITMLEEAIANLLSSPINGTSLNAKSSHRSSSS